MDEYLDMLRAESAKTVPMEKLRKKAAKMKPKLDAEAKKE
jgi:hypothetical protein